MWEKPVTGRLGVRLAAALAATGVAALSALAPTVASGGDASWPSAVTARYRLHFNGFEVGSYQFGSQFDGKTYQAQSNAKISALFGAFKWRGDISSEGTIDKSAPRPHAYQMNYKARSKNVAVRLGFGSGRVTEVTLVPNKPPSPQAVPVKPEHFEGVLDPMTAILAISHPSSAKPCDRRIPIFDGKARFDLVMSFKAQQRLQETPPTGQPAELLVCRVKYVPIAGHKPKDFVDPWVDYDHIEIALRPVPRAGLYVPYRITIPTTIGAAEMTAESVDITSGDREQIALRQ
jgi:hypothetical protein